MTQQKQTGIIKTMPNWLIEAPIFSVPMVYRKLLLEWFDTQDRLKYVMILRHVLES